MTANELCGLHVSRETMERLQGFAALLEKWNAKINLVAASTLPNFWDRHIVDSAQLFAHAPEGALHWADLGSGGGLPGLVCAVLSKEFSPDRTFTLIESDARKAAFLTTAIREFDLSAQVLTSRVEATDPQSADVVSARALATLPLLLPLVARHLAENGVALLPKGRNYNEELAAAQREWHFDIAILDSQTDPLAKLLILKDLKRV